MKLLMSKEWFEKHISADENFEVGACNPAHFTNVRCENGALPTRRVWRYRIRIRKNALVPSRRQAVIVRD